MECKKKWFVVVPHGNGREVSYETLKEALVHTQDEGPLRIYRMPGRLYILTIYSPFQEAIRLVHKNTQDL